MEQHPAQCLAWIAGRSLDRSQSTAVETANGACELGEDGCMVERQSSESRGCHCRKLITYKGAMEE